MEAEATRFSHVFTVFAQYLPLLADANASDEVRGKKHVFMWKTVLKKSHTIFLKTKLVIIIIIREHKTST